ncbi:MAG: hypothetical protein ACEY26_00575 [Candidatus Hodgkinia cicadicola]
MFGFSEALEVKFCNPSIVHGNVLNQVAAEGDATLLLTAVNLTMENVSLCEVIID